MNATGKVPLSQLGLYDGIVVVVHSAYAWSMTTQDIAMWVTGADAALGVSGGYVSTTPPSFTGVFSFGGGQLGYGTFLASAPFPALFAVITLTNASGGTIASDTVTVNVFGIKAQVDNPVGNPVQQQAANGSYANLDYTNGGSAAGPTGQTGSSSETATIFNAGGYAASLTWDAMNFTLTVDGGTGVSATFSLTLFFGGAIIATVGGNATLNAATSITLPAGTWQPAKSVSNSGVTVQAVVTVTGTASGVSGTFNWAGIQMVYESVTPPVEVTSVA
jgi:hypothetical protein